MVVNCMIIDDEPLAVQILAAYISKMPGLNLTGWHTEPLKALPHLSNQEVDLLFLDIRMPDLNGIDFLRSLPQRPVVIFTTAYSDYAIEGFELKAVDYLVKPISFERFVSAVNHAREYIEFKVNKAAPSKDYFFINASHKIHKLFYNDILYLEGFKDYTKIFLSNSSHPLVVLQNIKHFEELLRGNAFIRIHRSYIVSLSKLTTITRKSVTIGQHSIPVSDNFRDRLLSAIQ